MKINPNSVSIYKIGKGKYNSYLILKYEKSITFITDFRRISFQNKIWNIFSFNTRKAEMTKKRVINVTTLKR